MNYSSVMVHVEDNEVGMARVRLAADIAARFGGRVLGVMGSPTEAPATDGDTSGAMLGEAATLYQDIGATRVNRAEAAFWEVANATTGRFEWRGRTGCPREVVIQTLRAADILMLGQRRVETASIEALDPADLLMATGRPLLIAPSHPERGPIGEAAVVAWTDSPEAQRAVLGALPMLKSASGVHVIEIAAEGALSGAKVRTADVADYLGTHGVVASAHVVRSDGSARGEQIIRFAQTARAGLIVAGGSGHAQMRYGASGGVTHDLLIGAPVCLIVSH